MDGLAFFESYKKNLKERNYVELKKLFDVSAVNGIEKYPGMILTLLEKVGDVLDTSSILLPRLKEDDDFSYGLKMIFNVIEKSTGNEDMSSYISDYTVDGSCISVSDQNVIYLILLPVDEKSGLYINVLPTNKEYQLLSNPHFSIFEIEFKRLLDKLYYQKVSSAANNAETVN